MKHMERTVLGAATIVLAITAQAQLSPTTEAPLYRHLLEVNKEWRVMDPMPAGGDRMVHFTNEAERTRFLTLRIYHRVSVERRLQLRDQIRLHPAPRNHILVHPETLALVPRIRGCIAHALGDPVV